MATSRLAALALTTLGVCSQQPSQLEHVHTTPMTPPPPKCRAMPAGEALAEWPAGECPLVLLRDREGVRLESLAEAPARPSRGQPPQCRVAQCRYEGVQTPLGPMIIASEPGAESEVPVAVYLGFVAAGGQIAFVDLWAGAGDMVVEDSTTLGPAHALVPMQCGRELGLFAGARLPAGEAVEPPPELRAREGRVAIEAGEVEPKPGAADGCTPLTLPLP